MLQALLRGSIPTQIRHENKEIPVYELVVANKDGKLGPQLNESKAGSCTPPDALQTLASAKPGKLPTLGCGVLLMGLGRLTAASIPIAGLVPGLSHAFSGAPSMDKHGSQEASYDFTSNGLPIEGGRVSGIRPRRYAAASI